MTNGEDREVAISSVSDARLVPFDPEPARERIRGLLALFLFFLLAAIVAAAFLLVAIKRVSIGDMRPLLEIVLGPVVALTGSAVGFYFGGRTSSQL